MDAVCRPCFGWLCFILCVGLLMTKVKCATEEATITTINHATDAPESEATINPATGAPESDTDTADESPASGGSTEDANVGATESSVTEAVATDTGGSDNTEAPAGATEIPAGAHSGTEAVAEDASESPASSDTEAKTDGATEIPAGGHRGTEAVAEDATPASSDAEAITDGATVNPAEGATDEDAEGATENPAESVTAGTSENPAHSSETESEDAGKKSTDDSSTGTKDDSKHGKGNPKTEDVTSKDTQHVTTRKPDSTTRRPTTERLTTAHPNSTAIPGNVTYPPPLAPVAIANVTGQNITHQSVTIDWEQLNEGDHQSYRLVGYMLSPRMVVESKIVDVFINATNEMGKHRLYQENLDHHTYYLFCVLPIEPTPHTETDDEHLEVTDGSITFNTTDCFSFRTPYNPLNPKAVVALAFAVVIMVVFFVTMISAKVCERSGEEESNEKKSLVEQLKLMKRQKRKQNYGSDRTLLSGYKIMDDEQSEYESVSLDTKPVVKDTEGNEIELDKMSMPDECSDTGYLLEGM